MHTLSARAKNFIAGKERFATTTSREQLEKVFAQHKIPVFEPLIYFQQQYSGYDLSIGSNIPFTYSLLRGEGGYPQLSDTGFIEFIENDTRDTPRYFFAVDSDDMMTFTLDESGIFYEENQPLAMSFDKYIEQLAVKDEIYRLGLKKLGDHTTTYPADAAKKLNLSIIPEASDEYTQWFNDDKTYLMQREHEILVFSNEESARLEKG